MVRSELGVLGKLLRAVRTLRHVPPAMLLARVAYRLRYRWYGSPFYSFMLPEGVEPWAPTAVPCLTLGSAAVGQAVAARQFSFIGHTHTLAEASGPWLPPKVSLLWQFNLHYHVWLHDLKAAGLRAEAEALLTEWLEHHAAWHSVVWHPYPLSLRIVAWLQVAPWLLAGVGDEFKHAFLTCLVRQVAHLNSNVEHWLGGNHVIKNLKALLLAGLNIPGQQALVVGALAALLRELKVQVHADGGQVEGSPSYHLQVLTDLLEIATCLRKHGGVPAQLTDALERMGPALALWQHPDGALALFNDGAVEDAAQVQAILTKLKPDPAPELLPDTGYARLARGSTVVVFDSGPLGPAANPGHAHADMLSFELSIGTQRMVVNGGTLAYQHSHRNLYRGTAMHSAPGLTGQDGAEVWGGFRVGRRPTRHGLSVRTEATDAITAIGGHNGYIFRGVPWLERNLTLAADGLSLTGQDTWGAAVPRWWQKLGWGVPQATKVYSHFGVHPGVQVKLVSDTEARLTLPNMGQARAPNGGVWQLVLTTPGWRLDVKDFPYAPHFGMVQPGVQLQALGRWQPQHGAVLQWVLRQVAPPVGGAR
jgi:uncharacterized heparinase superfamily protein